MTTTENRFYVSGILAGVIHSRWDISLETAVKMSMLLIMRWEATGQIDVAELTKSFGDLVPMDNKSIKDIQDLKNFMVELYGSSAIRPPVNEGVDILGSIDEDVIVVHTVQEENPDEETMVYGPFNNENHALKWVTRQNKKGYFRVTHLAQTQDMWREIHVTPRPLSQADLKRMAEHIRQHQRTSRAHHFAPALGAMVDAGTIPLSDAFIFCRLPHEQQFEIAEKYTTMTHIEYLSWLTKAASTRPAPG